ncbi:hypothetical protein K466DRAFT_602409 [Polyporus arcularius HHB13444]|uniref:Uncharacterized protein n=1 Tax=Polyporus arcularius HHB13444 TaxID=1314778 RepID=A0A5C3P4M7_9APHY|nr:hypothetical protein K466DRAFT_602409 [Polyporus arcularius HHB13444]
MPREPHAGVPSSDLTKQNNQPGKNVGPDNKYNTSTKASQGKVCYMPYEVEIAADSFPSAHAPNDTFINGTVFVMVTDANPVITPFNISMLNDHVVAGPALYQSV